MTLELLMAAIQSKNLKEVEYIYLLETSNNSNFTFDVTTNQTTPLCLAASLDDRDTVNLLISHGASVNYKVVDNGKAPLHFACDKEEITTDNVEIVRELIAAGADINVQDDDGQAPIHFACSRGNLDIIGCLLTKNVDLDVTDFNDETPLVRACHADDIALMKKLINNGCLFDYPNNLPLRLCVRRGNIPAVKMLLEQGEDINKGDYLSFACQSSNLDMMDYLHSLGVDINRCENSTIFKFTPLHVACLSRAVKYVVVDKLLSWGADVKLTSATGDTALHYAAQQLDIHKVKSLLQYGAPVNVVDDIEMTPLAAALTSIFDPDLMVCIIELFSAVGCNMSEHLIECIKTQHENRVEESNRIIVPLLQKLSKTPRSLKNLCRITIRHNLGIQFTKKLSYLPLPKLLIDFLNLDDVQVPDTTVQPF